MLPYPRSGYDVLVNVTDVCDARCVMCNIWKNPETADSFIEPELLQSVRPVASLSFAGGEPFLHQNVVEAVRVVHDNNPKAKIIFSTNGFRTDTIVEQVERIVAFHANTQVTISLDGVGRVHDRVRGIPGAWEKVNRTYDRLGTVGLRQRNFCFTLTAENYHNLPDVYAHAKEKGAPLSIGVAQSSKYLNVDVPLLDPDKVYPVLNPIIDDYLRSWKPFNWARAFFLYGILRYLETGRRPIPCDALSAQIMIDQTGRVHSCHPILLEAGSLKEQALSGILQQPGIERLREEVKRCHACWEVCTARSGMRNQMGRVGVWALWNKGLAHLRLRQGTGSTTLFPSTRVPAVQQFDVPG